MREQVGTAETVLHVTIQVSDDHVHLSQCPLVPSTRKPSSRLRILGSLTEGEDRNGFGARCRSTYTPKPDSYILNVLFIISIKAIFPAHFSAVAHIGGASPGGPAVELRGGRHGCPVGELLERASKSGSSRGAGTD
jgi:hypothetical protein